MEGKPRLPDYGINWVSQSLGLGRRVIYPGMGASSGLGDLEVPWHPQFSLSLLMLPTCTGLLYMKLASCYDKYCRRVDAGLLNIAYGMCDPLEGGGGEYVT